MTTTPPAAPAHDVPASAPPSTPATPPSTPWSAGRVVAFVAGALLVLTSLGLLRRGRGRGPAGRTAPPAAAMTTTDQPPRLPPAWFMHAFWRVHRALHRLSGGRFLWEPGGKRGWGALGLTTTGRRSGRPRTVVLAYLEDGPDLVLLAMNGWDEGDPAWWLNLRDCPLAEVRLPGQPPRQVRAHAAQGPERDRIWQLWREVDEGLDAYAASRTTPTPVVVLAPA